MAGQGTYLIKQNVVTTRYHRTYSTHYINIEHCKPRMKTCFNKVQICCTENYTELLLMCHRSQEMTQGVDKIRGEGGGN